MDNELSIFLSDWFDTDLETMTVKTSGSTGVPQLIVVSKERMRASAAMTCAALQLKAGQKALLCLPMEFIAGQMMVVRALVAGLDLFPVVPSSHPLSDVDCSIHFAAMTPMQVAETVTNQTEYERLQQIKCLIIGGGSIPESLEIILQSFPNPVYATYGMTETLSHIALRRINGEQKSLFFKPLPNIAISQNPDQTLSIHAPLLCDDTIMTNDIVQIDKDGNFQIIGRNDNIINSGGIKINPETLEEQLEAIIKNPFAITAVPDNVLGQRLVLLIETETIDKTLIQVIHQQTSKYIKPKQILSVIKLPLTETGKRKRDEITRLARQIIECK